MGEFNSTSVMIGRVKNSMTKPAQCAWCGSEITSVGRGRPRKYCSASCKQRAYEQRHNVVGTQIPDDAVILAADKADQLRDELYELRCVAEDIQTAAREEASPGEMAALCQELVDLARAIEKLR